MHPIYETLGDPTSFLDTLHAELEQIGIDISSLLIDHICYRIETLMQYEKQKAFLEQHATLLSEEMIGGRPIATYKLDTPIAYSGKEIPCVELPAPKRGSPYAQGWEHIEVVTDVSLEECMCRYPQIDFEQKGIHKKSNRDIAIQLSAGVIKFHEQSLEEVIRIERGAT